jgi:chromosome segregation ATPase
VGSPALTHSRSARTFDSANSSQIFDLQRRIDEQKREKREAQERLSRLEQEEQELLEQLRKTYTTQKQEFRHLETIVKNPEKRDPL